MTAMLQAPPERVRPLGRPPRAGRSNAVVVLVGWLWRIAVGAVFCTSYPLAVLALGWLARRTQAVVLRRWWLASRHRAAGNFDDFADELGVDAPAIRPRWFAAERPGARLAGRGVFGVLVRLPWLAVASAWRNLAVGVSQLFGIGLLTLPAVLVVFGAWEYGWLNSFHKGYELRAAAAVVTLLVGFPVFVASMMYLPMATTHAAAAGECRAFFDFRVVTRLIRTRPLAYLGVTAFVGLASLPVEFLKMLPYFMNEQFDPWFATATDAELRQFLQGYTLRSAFVLFVVMLIWRHLAARVYAGAMLAALRRGVVAVEEVPPRLRGWLERLDLLTPPEARPAGWLPAAARGAGRFGRGVVYASLAAVWVLFLVKVYVSEFFHYHPVVGYLNHPVVMLPCVNYTPPHLTGADVPAVEE
jgi:hypothetical protein